MLDRVFYCAQKSKGFEDKENSITENREVRLKNQLLLPSSIYFQLGKTYGYRYICGCILLCVFMTGTRKWINHFIIILFIFSLYCKSHIQSLIYGQAVAKATAKRQPRGHHHTFQPLILQLIRNKNTHNTISNWICCNLYN